MVTKKDIIEFITPFFNDCNGGMIEISHFDVKVSIWYHTGGTLDDLLKILNTIKSCPFIGSTWDVWRESGYYDSTEDITMDFIIDRELVKKTIKVKKK
jgi:hypothetical protein